MQKKLLISAVVALVLIGGVVWLMQRHQVAISQPVQVDQIYKIDAKLDKQPVKTEVLPTFEEAIAPNQKSQTRLPQGQLYTSEKNKFSVMLPPDTKVSESDEAGYTFTFFTLKGSLHEIIVASYDGDVNEGNLNAMIASGKIGYLLNGGFTSENQVQCGESGSVCFLTQLYTENGFPLVGLIESIVSKTEFQKVYSITMGTSNTEVTDKDLAIFSMVHDSFRLHR